MRSRLALLLVVLALAPLAVALFPSRAAAPPVRQRVRVMSFNILKGGGAERVEHAARVIAAAGADIVGVQEPEEHLPALARALGFFASERAAVLSRYPIVEDLPARGVRIRLPDRIDLVVFNVHLPSEPNGSHLLRDGVPVERILAAERPRQVALERVLGRVRVHVAAGEPVVLTGDFNACSHLDGGPVPWPTSLAAEAIGLRDAYREHHPDPAAYPGYTWTPRWAGETLDRIDYVLFAGLEVERAFVAGEPGPLSDLAFAGWQSDHRAVLADLVTRP